MTNNRKHAELMNEAMELRNELIFLKSEKEARWVIKEVIFKMVEVLQAARELRIKGE